MAKYLDKSGVTYLWNKIKGLFTDQSLNTKNKTYAGAINEINTKVGNLTGAFLWKGKFDTLPAVTNYEAGNVVGVGKKEYVLTVTGGTKAWEEFGDEGSYLLKTIAEETYLKKAAGEVKTANLADNAVISSKLATGARKPIILTPETTEVDEETYQKLLSDDVDVVFKDIYNTSEMALKEIDSDKNIRMSFNVVICAENIIGEGVDVMAIQQYDVEISSASPHSVVTKGPVLLEIEPKQYVTKSTLTPVLQEIDLTGTDAERKAKLDQFETDWKALTGDTELNGAKFIGRYYADRERFGGPLEILFVKQYFDPYYYIGVGCATSETDTNAVAMSYQGILTPEGSLTITPLFSHLEAITVYTDNTPEHMQANLDNIAAYEANLQALGVDTTKGYMIPITASGRNGFLSTRSGNYPYAGYAAADSSVTDFYNILILGTGEYYDSKIQSEASGDLHTISKQIVPAINEVNALAKGKQDKLISGTNIKTINNQTLLGSGDIAISGGGSGDVTAAGDNTFTGNNVFSGIAIADILDGTQYQITGDNGVLMFTSGATNEDIQLSGVATPTYSNSAANKSYVDTQINTALGTVLTQLQNI